MQNLEVISTPTNEAVTLAELKAHCRVSATTDDTYMTTLRIAAREQVEKDLGMVVASQAYRLHTELGFPTIQCLPVQPVYEVTSITYTDADDAEQTLSAALYTLKAWKDPPEIEYEDGLPVGTDVVINFTAGFSTVSPLRGIEQVFIIGAGSGYTDGTYSVAVSGTPGTGTVSLVVAGGIITTATITTIGTGFTAASTLTTAAFTLTGLGAGTGASLLYTHDDSVIEQQTYIPNLIKHAVMFLASSWYENREPVVVGTIVTQLPLAYQRIIDRLRVQRFV